MTTVTTTKRWTLAEIKAANEAAGFYFFDRKTMKFFGDTMRSFRVLHLDGKVFVRRVKAANYDRHGQWIGLLREFYPSTGELRTILPKDL